MFSSQAGALLHNEYGGWETWKCGIPGPLTALQEGGKSSWLLQ